MAITLSTADKALKTYYLDAVTDQLNNGINPFFAAIEKNSKSVYGKEAKQLVTYGFNGGIGAGSEDGILPNAVGNNYAEFTTTLKNLYGVIEISDKAIRASANNEGAFISLLDAEMEGLLKASKYNFERMLYGDGTGALGYVSIIDGKKIYMNTTIAVIEGMSVEIYDNLNNKVVDETVVLSVDRKNACITVADEIDGMSVGCHVCMKGSIGKELSGLQSIFNQGTEIYGYDKASNPWICPSEKTLTDGVLTENDIQKVLDEIESVSGSAPNIILCSWGVRRAILKLFEEKNRVVNSVELAGGFKAISYNGIPVVADRFCPENTMYLLNTNDFVLHQLCDWQWLEGDDGSILKQVPGKPVYTATLVKYADLLCSRPCGQGMISNITEA